MFAHIGQHNAIIVGRPIGLPTTFQVKGFLRPLRIPLAPSPAPTGGEGCKGFARGQFPRALAWERGLEGAGESASGRLRAKTLHLKAAHYPLTGMGSGAERSVTPLYRFGGSVLAETRRTR